jgi:hypothetical protein
MKSFRFPFSTGSILTVFCFSVLAQPAPIIEDVAMVTRLMIRSEVGTVSFRQECVRLMTGCW